MKRLQELLTNAGAWLARPWVVAVVLLYVVLWLIFDPGHFGWHGLATIAHLADDPLYPEVRTPRHSGHTREAGRTVAGAWRSAKSDHSPRREGA